MAVIFLLGPGMWAPERPRQAPSPMDVRRRLAAIFRADGHRVILMEDEADQKGEDMIQKFDRLLRDRVDNVVIYWPPQARMQTTCDEMILLCDRREYVQEREIPIWVLHHSSVAAITRDEFRILEAGNRSRYLTAVARLGVSPLEWGSDEELDERARLLSMELES